MAELLALAFAGFVLLACRNTTTSPAIAEDTHEEPVLSNTGCVCSSNCSSGLFDEKWCWVEPSTCGHEGCDCRYFFFSSWDHCFAPGRYVGRRWHERALMDQQHKFEHALEQKGLSMEGSAIEPTTHAARNWSPSAHQTRWAIIAVAMGTVFTAMYKRRRQNPVAQNAILDSEDERCVVCFIRPRDALLSCSATAGHRCCCLACAQALMRGTKRCPVCQGRISRVLRIYG